MPKSGHSTRAHYGRLSEFADKGGRGSTNPKNTGDVLNESPLTSAHIASRQYRN